MRVLTHVGVGLRSLELVRCQSMAEKISQSTRSRMMASIRSRDTAPEMIVRRHLHEGGYRYCVSHTSLPGRPDLVLAKWRVAVFIHGCFWHGHERCRFFQLPATRRVFWTAKIDDNKRRDRSVTRQLLDSDWRVAEVWECALREDPLATLGALTQFIAADAQFLSLESRQSSN